MKVIQGLTMSRGRQGSAAAVLGLAVLVPTCGEGLVPAQAQAAAPAAAVYTRAQVRSLPSSASGEAPVLRLKIMPRASVPFSTLTFHVRDPALLQGISIGDDVAYRAERIDGENVLVAIRKVARCMRFQACPTITD